MWPGRTFIKRLINLLCCFCNKDHPNCVNQEFSLDLQGWQQFLSSWHGVTFWLYPGMSSAQPYKLLQMQLALVVTGPTLIGQWFCGLWASSQAHRSRPCAVWSQCLQTSSITILSKPIFPLFTLFTLHRVFLIPCLIAFTSN